MPQMSLVLPAYNEEKNIVRAVENANNYLKKKFKSFEIVVVNDGSNDETALIVSRLAKTNRKIKLINHDINKGYGVALRSGFAACEGDLIFYTDADNQYDIAEMDKLLEYVGEYDIVAGFRLHHSDPTSRIVISWSYNQLIHLLLGLRIKDVDCSFKLYKRKVFENIILKSDTGLIDAEILIKAKKAGFSIFQIGVNHYQRIAGHSIYEIGTRNKYFAFVSPKVPIKIFKEIKMYWKELH